MSEYAEAETRAMHVQWAKEIALDYLQRGALKDAMAAMLNELHRYDDTLALAADPMKLAEGYERVMDGDIDGMRAWIERFQ
jgi:hypothetical protein